MNDYLDPDHWVNGGEKVSAAITEDIEAEKELSPHQRDQISDGNSPPTRRGVFRTLGKWEEAK